MTYAEEHVLKSCKKNSFAPSFMHLKLRREVRKITWKWEKHGRIALQVS